MADGAPVLTHPRRTVSARSSRPGNLRPTRLRVLGGLAVVLAVLTLSGAEWRGPGSFRALPWLSGASGEGVTSGAYAAWRGYPVGLTGAWVDNNKDQVGMWPLRPGWDLSAWAGSLDIAIGAISRDESWQKAADGAYDARWRQSLTNLRDLWGARPGTVYIRFAHEMNGDWYPWKVDASTAQYFITAWQRFWALQREIFPAAKLVFSVNRESVGAGMDWRRMFPGRQYVDVLGVDYYNQNPYVGSSAQWDASADATDPFGAPVGIEQHLAFARSMGLPLAVPEWSGNADEGDSPAFIRGMYRFFRDHAGSGPGQLLYEIQFNVDMLDGRFVLDGPGARMPLSAEAYRDLW